MKRKDAVAIIQRALELGIRYFDTAASYGPSEDYKSAATASFKTLASKTDVRDQMVHGENGAIAQTPKTDYLDLWQLHHVSFSQELDTIFSSDQAIQALEEAMQKLVRCWHHWASRPKCDRRSVAPLSIPPRLFLSMRQTNTIHTPSSPVLPVAQQQNVGVIAMKVPAYGRFQAWWAGWYASSSGYTLSQPGVQCVIALKL